MYQNNRLIGGFSNKFRNYKSRIFVDGGNVRDDTVTSMYMKLCEDNDMSDQIQLAWLGESGCIIRNSGIYNYCSKIHSMFNSTYGPELITGGTFDSVAGWSLSSGWTISGGVLNIANASIWASSNFAVNLQKDVLYKYSITIVSITGNIFLQEPSNISMTGASWSASGTYSGFYRCTLGGALVIKVGVASTNAVIDNVSFTEVVSNDSGQLTDATQVITGSQPFVGGNIAPNEKLCLKNPNGGSNYMTHPTISFSATDSWSVSSVYMNTGASSPNGATNLYGDVGVGSCFRIGNKDNNFFTFVNSLGVSNAFLTTTNNTYGKISIVTLVADGLGNLFFYKDGTLKYSTTGINTSFIISGLMYARSAFIYGNVYSHIIRSQALTPTQVLSESNFLRNLYPEITNVSIPSFEVLVNGGFDNVLTGWTVNSPNNLQSEVIINEDHNTAYHLNSIHAFSGIYQYVALNLLTRYKLTYDCKVISGSFHASNNTIIGVDRTVDNSSEWTTVTEYFIPTTTVALTLYAGNNGCECYIDNVSLINDPQVWSTSNCEMVCTPQGTPIPEMQANGNVEKYITANALGTSDTNSITGLSIGAGTITSIGIDGGVNPIGDYMIKAVLNAQPDNLSSDQSIPILSGMWYKFNIRVYPTAATTTFRVVKLIGILNNIVNPQSLIVNQWNTITVFYQAPDSVTAYFLIQIANGSSYTGTYYVDNASFQQIGWSGSQELYDGIYAQTTGTVEQKTYAAVKAAAMWCHYNNDISIGAVYGKLYNWFAVKLLQMDIDYYNVANPTTPWGWRLPTQTDFTILQNNLGGSSVAGGKLKKDCLIYWASPNTGADNSSGFSMLMSGRRLDSDGTFYSTEGIIWSITDNGLLATRLYTNYGSSAIDMVQTSKIRGYSVRFIEN